VYFIGGIIILFVALLILPESPKYLYSKQLFQETRESLAIIAKFNGKKIDNNYIFATEVENDKDKEKRLGSDNGHQNYD
jgi:hypothetical protein